MKVVVAMSGGVDSSVAAALLKKDGHEVIGATMQLWPRDEEKSKDNGAGGCCSLSAIEDARRIAHKLDIPIIDLNDLAQTASETAQIGSYCTVFTATEVLDRIRSGERTEHIIRGLFDSVAKRIVEMDTLTDRVIMTGGVVAYNAIVATLLSMRTGIVVEIAPHPQEMGAFGAALYAEETSFQKA